MPDKISGLLRWCDRQLGRVTGLFAILGGLGVLALIGIILVGVFWRYVLNDPIFGIEDLSILVLAVVAGSSVLFGARNRAHVNVEVIHFFVGRRVTRWSDLLMQFALLFTLGMASYALWRKACGFKKACITENLSIEHTPFYYFLSVVMALYALQILYRICLNLWHFNGDDPLEDQN